MIWSSPRHYPSTLQQFLQYYGRTALSELPDWELLSGLRAKSILPDGDRAEILGELYHRHFTCLLCLCKARNWNTRTAEAYDFATEALLKVQMCADLFKIDPCWSEKEKQKKFDNWLARIPERKFLNKYAQEKSRRNLAAKYVSGPMPFDDNQEEFDVAKIPQGEQEDDPAPGFAPLPPPAPWPELLEYLLEFLQAKKDARRDAHVDFLLASVKYEVIGPKRRRVRSPVEFDDDILRSFCETLNKTPKALRKIGGASCRERV